MKPSTAPMLMSPLERKAAFKAAVTLHATTIGKAVKSFGVSYTHFMLVLEGKRRPSPRLKQAISTFIEESHIRIASAEKPVEERA